MKPHVEEAQRCLRLADRDITVLNILTREPDAHISIVCFHAQQAIEKSLKAVLYSRRIEFRRTHSLTNLAQLLRQHGVQTPVAPDRLRRLNPFAVTFRYDDTDISPMTREDAPDLVGQVRQWAEDQVSAAAKNDLENRAQQD